MRVERSRLSTTIRGNPAPLGEDARASARAEEGEEARAFGLGLTAHCQRGARVAIDAELWFDRTVSAIVGLAFSQIPQMIQASIDGSAIHFALASALVGATL